MLCREAMCLTFKWGPRETVALFISLDTAYLDTACSRTAGHFNRLAQHLPTCTQKSQLPTIDRNSCRVRALSRNTPVMCDVTRSVPGFITPRVVMQ